MLLMTSWAVGPMDAFALVESESVRKTKESRLSIMNEGRTASKKKGATRFYYPDREIVVQIEWFI